MLPAWACWMLSICCQNWIASRAVCTGGSTLNMHNIFVCTGALPQNMHNIFECNAAGSVKHEFLSELSASLNIQSSDHAMLLIQSALSVMRSGLLAALGILEKKQLVQTRKSCVKSSSWQWRHQEEGRVASSHQQQRPHGRFQPEQLVPYCWQP